MSVNPFHSKTTGNDAIHPATYVGSSDPASPDSSVTADNKLWIDTTTGTTFATGWLLKIRSASNTAWTTILDLMASLALKANLASPTFTGTPAAPTASPGTNTTQLATTAYAEAIAALKANLASPTFTGTPSVPDAENAEVWAVLTAAASGVGLEDAHDAGMHVYPAAIDHAVQDLTAAELNELGRLLQSELKRSSN